MKNYIKLFFVFVLFFTNTKAQQQTMESINNDELRLTWNAIDGTIFRSNVSKIYNGSSMKWNWDKSNAYLQIKNFPKDIISKNDRSMFSFWVYNQKPLKDNLTVVVEQDKNNYYTFDFGLNFTGWRTAWLLFSRDVKIVGKPTVVNSVKIYAPKSQKNGELFLQDVRIIADSDPRSHMQDNQLPYVNKGVEKTANAHWSALYNFSQFPEKNYIYDELSPEMKADLKTISDRVNSAILERRLPSSMTLEKLKEEYDYWDIKKVDGFYHGKPIFTMNDREIFPKEKLPKKIVKEYTDLMLNIALKYNYSKNPQEKAELNKMYISMLNYMDDQGWAAGSGMGALHHLGYNFKGFYASCLIMKKEIAEAGILKRTEDAMYWFSGLGRIFQDKEDLPHSNVDVFNTILGGMMSAILITENEKTEATRMLAFSDWISTNMLPQLSIKGALKIDGSIVHHGNLYPAYGVGGIDGLSAIVYDLHGTSFQVSDEAYKTFKNVLMTMHRFTNPNAWSMSVSGRHPTGNWGVKATPFLYTALAGKGGVDKDLASAYMLIKNDPNDKWTKEFKKQNIEPKLQTGHWNVNYGLLDIHRRNDWLLTVRGHNRYFISHESYPGANVFGRFIAYGQLEVLYNENDKVPTNFIDEGWDWSLIPGTTTLNLPVDLMRANIINADEYSGVEEMLISDEMFAGGTNLDDQGLFSMKIHGHDKYDMGSFRANKSWFTFDNVVIALGSNITNTRTDYPTKTTLFQNFLGRVLDNENKLFINGIGVDKAVNMTKWNGNQAYILDNRRIGYVIPNSSDLDLYIGEQKSRDQKDKKDTQGYFETLTFNHGKAPKNASYEYAMLIDVDDSQLSNFAKQVKEGKVYKVKQQDGVAHILEYEPLNMSGLAIFKANKPLNNELVKNTDKPSLIMYKELSNKNYEIAITDPDLAFYEGEDDSPVVDGKRQEVSIYSREWYTTPSIPSVMKVTLKGKWKVEGDSAKVQKVEYGKNETYLYVHCEYGIATKLNLKKI
ncbi:hypothetical protein KRX57_01950 [Weeksellaceae bacterium TAE3-ERU29]|nr:hypothetical protein [Weeksellaceae bacterium TAE3-ERU29]